VKRAMLIASLTICLGVAVCGGFAFWDGTGSYPLGYPVTGPAPQTAQTTLPVTPVPPLSAPCNVKPLPASKRARFTISGRCNLGTDGPAQCTASGGDDFGAYFPVKTVAGDPAYFSLGIEGYKGPRNYTADVVFFVLYGGHLAQWQAPSAAVTITAGSVVVPRTLLAAAPGTGARASLSAQGTLPCKQAA